MFSLSIKGKLLVSLLIVASSFILFSRTTRSEDFTAICNNSGCSSPSISIFSESGILPGQSFERTMAVENNRSKDITVKLSAGKKSETDDIFLDVLRVVIKNPDNTMISSLSLADFLNGTKLDLGTVSQGSRKSLIIAIDFDINANNTYQSKKAVFDIHFEIAGDDISSTTTTTTDGSSQTTGTTTTITSTGTVAGATTVFEGLPSILGLGTGIIDGSQEEQTSFPEVLGTSCQDRYVWWWIPLLIQLLIGSIFLFVFKRKQIAKRYFFLSEILVALLSQIAHALLPCNCATGIWCPRYVYLNISLTTLLCLTYVFISLKKSPDKEI